MAQPITNRLLNLQSNEGGGSSLPRSANGLQAELLRIRAHTYEAELDDGLHDNGSIIFRAELGSSVGADGTRELGTHQADCPLGRNLGFGLSRHPLPKRKSVSDDFESDLRRIRTRIAGVHNQSHFTPGHYELETSLARLRTRCNDPDLDLDESALALHNKDMQAIVNNYRFSRICELGFRPTILDLEYGRASLMELLMEPERPAEDEPDVGIVRRRVKARKVRQPYTVTCALKKTNWFEMSFTWPNSEFREFYRISQSTFWEIVNLIKSDEGFRLKGTKPQRPVHYQLGVFLLRYGCPGSGARIPMGLTAFGEGTILLYCRRVIDAIRRFGLKVVGWPTAERKKIIMAGFQKKCGLNGIVGALDGILFKLSHKPIIEGDTYICRKGGPAVTVQVTCDHEGRLTSFQSGLPGSRPDTTVWSSSELCRMRNQVFEPGEFLLADGGYPISSFVLIPFDSRERQEGDGERKRLFNEKITKARVVIERTFGQLKGRFPALKLLGPVEDMGDLYRAIEALMILYNICYDLHDRADGFADDFIQSRIDNNEEPYDYVEQGPDIAEMDVNNGQEVFTGNLRQAGLFFRDRCMDIVCPN